jgi:arginyl-tRNA synthetase
VNKFGLSLDCRYREILGETIEMPEDAYLGDDITSLAKEFRLEFGDAIIHLPEEERRAKLVNYAMPKNIRKLENDLLRYRIKYDNWFRESTLHDSGEAMKIVELLKQRGHTYEKDGAVWFSAEQFGSDKDIVLVRSNGVPTYIVPDIAYHYNKLVTRNFDIAIDILGADHHGYAARMKAALSALGIDTSRLRFIIMQMVRLIRNGETVKLSKRSGKAITLVTLLDEVPIDAARFFFNLRDANTHLDFDLDLAIEESSKNPVYYVQYAHARICRLFEKFEPFDLAGDFVYTETAEKLLVKRLSNYPDVINESACSLDPSKVTRYAYETAQAFHKFYDSCRIRDEEYDVVRSRLALCKAVKVVIRSILELLKVSTPEKM